MVVYYQHVFRKFTLKNYSSNRLLKDLNESTKVALNLKLDESYKRIWFGNINVGVGNDSFYDLKGNLMNFGKKNKYYFLTNLNTIGNDATGNIESLIRPHSSDGPSSLGNNQNVRNLLHVSSGNLNFKKSRTNFNHAELVSLNAIFNPSKKIKIKTLGFFNWDETDFFKNSIETVNVNGSNFTNTEDTKVENKSKIVFGKLDITYDISQTKLIEATTKYNHSDFNDNSNLLFNGNSTIENLKHNNSLFDQKINYTNRLNDNKALLITSRFINEKAPQNYSLNQFFYEDLFPDFENANTIIQQSTNQMQFAGIESYLLDKKANDDLLELQLGNSYRRDNLNTMLSLLENNTLLQNPENYQNNTVYRVNNLYFKSKYTYKIKDINLVGKLNFHQFFNSLSNNSFSKNQNPFFINPNFGIDWKINKNHKISSSYSHNSTNAKILDVYNDFVLTGFRSFTKGTGNLNRLNSSGLIFNYRFENWKKQFFANANLVYGKNHDFFSSNSIIEQNYTQTEKILVKNRAYIGLNSRIDYFLKFLSSNIKLNLSYSKSNYKNSVNNSELRQVTSKNYNYGFEFRSGFKGLFNYHFGTAWNTTKIETSINNSFSNNMSFLDLILVFNKRTDLQLQSERYYFGNLNTDNTYYFLDFDVRYEAIKSKLTIGITGKNLTNTKIFRNFSVSDIGTSTTEYRLLPTYILLKLEYRF